MTVHGGQPPRKVLRIIARLNVGGPARHVVIVNEGLSARGYDTLLVHGSIGSDEASLEHLAAEHGLRAVQIAELGRAISVFDDLTAWMKLLRLMFAEQPDVVHTHTAKAGTLGRLAAVIFNATRRRQRRCVVIHTFHGHVLAGYFGSVGSALVRAIERGLALVTDRIVAISPAQRHDLVTIFKVAPADRTVIIPLGLDLRTLLTLPAAAPNLRAELGIPPEAFVVGYLGRFAPIKDLPTLVAAVGEASRVCASLWLILAGDGPSRPALESAVRAAGIESRVRFLGWREDLAAIYSTLDVCALASLNEGTPVTLIEAMAAARAVVATSVGGVVDVVTHGRTGLIVPPHDPTALAEAIVRLERNVEERKQMGEAGRLEVAARYFAERLVSEIDALYVSALAEKRRPMEGLAG